MKKLLINQSGKRLEALKCQKIRNSRLAILGMIYCPWDLSYIQRWAQNGPARYLGREYQCFLYHTVQKWLYWQLVVPVFLVVISKKFMIRGFQNRFYLIPNPSFSKVIDVLSFGILVWKLHLIFWLFFGVGTLLSLLSGNTDAQNDGPMCGRQFYTQKALLIAYKFQDLGI